MGRIAAVILHALLGKGQGEQLVEQGREASTQDLVRTLQQAGAERVILVSSDKTFAEHLRNLGVVTVSPIRGTPFHFGNTIRRVIAAEKLDGLLYFGSGSGGLLTREQVENLVSFSQRPKRGALFNNFYSCDFFAVAEARDLLEAELPPIDNPLGLVLSDLGFPCFALPREAATQFDIDTPTDLLLLSATGRGGKEIRTLLEKQRLTHPSVPRLLERLGDRTAHLYLIGRVNPVTWSHFEGEVACRTSALIEGRGMRSYTDHRGKLLTKVLDAVGIHRFFTWLAQSADAAIIDSRPLLSKGGQLPAPSDRFASDLLCPEQIENRLWAEFTREAIASEIPILLGGHSLVSGGLYLLAEVCWKDRDLPRRLHPGTFDWRKESP